MNKLTGALGAAGFLIVLGAAGASDCGVMSFVETMVRAGLGLLLMASAGAEKCIRERADIFRNNKKRDTPQPPQPRMSLNHKPPFCNGDSNI